MGVLADDPLLLLFVVVGLGAALGRVRVRGIGLGPAAALFVGLAVLSVDADLANTPPIIPTLGLALFIYTIGLASGPSFVEGFRQGGARVVLGTVLVLGVIAGVVAIVIGVLDLDVGARAGLFAGTQTNTPALQASIEALDAEMSRRAGDRSRGRLLDRLSVRRVVDDRRRLLVDAPCEPIRPARRAATGIIGGAANATSWTVEILRSELPPLGELRHWQGERLAFSRVDHDGEVDLAVNATCCVTG